MRVAGQAGCREAKVDCTVLGVAMTPWYGGLERRNSLRSLAPYGVMGATILDRQHGMMRGPHGMALTLSAIHRILRQQAFYLGGCRWGRGSDKRIGPSSPATESVAAGATRWDMAIHQVLVKGILSGLLASLAMSLRLVQPSFLLGIDANARSKPAGLCNRACPIDGKEPRP